jgi:hypothetical protein
VLPPDGRIALVDDCVDLHEVAVARDTRCLARALELPLRADAQDARLRGLAHRVRRGCRRGVRAREQHRHRASKRTDQGHL